MNAPAAEWIFPSNPPLVRKVKPRISGIDRGAVYFSVLPARAVFDRRLKNRHFRLLAVLGAHANPHGVLFVRQTLLGAECGRSRQWVTLNMHDLRRWGYVRRLKSKSTRKRPATRLQVLWLKGSPVPPRDVAEDWPFRTPFEFSQPLRCQPMNLHESRVPLTPETVHRDNEITRACYQVTDYFANRRWALTKQPTPCEVNVPIARTWLLSVADPAHAGRHYPFKSAVAACRAHVDALLAQAKKDGIIPSGLMADYPGPVVAAK